MKSLGNRILLTLVIGAMVSSLAFAKTKKDTITFTESVRVNGTLLKSGTYDMRFNEETSELAILKNGKVVAKTTGRVEQRSHKADRTEIKTSTSNGGVELIGVAFSGSDKNILVERGSDAARN
jgi:hypothetical protein